MEDYEILHTYNLYREEVHNANILKKYTIDFKKQLFTMESAIIPNYGSCAKLLP